MSHATAIAILPKPEDAERFNRERPEARAILALSPLVLAKLDPDLRALAVTEPFSDGDHARCVARGAKALRQVLGAARREAALRPGTIHSLHLNLRHMVHRIGRTWALLGDEGPWLIPDEGGWTLERSREAAHRALLLRLSPYAAKGAGQVGETALRRRHVGKPPPLPALFRLLRNLLLRSLRARGPWIVTRARNLIFGLEKHLEHRTPPFRRLVVQTAGLGLGAYKALLTAVRHDRAAAAHVAVPLAAYPAPAAREAVDRALAALSDPVVRQGLTSVDLEILRCDAEHCEGLYDDAAAAIEALAPHCFISRQNSGHHAVVAEAAGAAGVPRYVVNYNSLVPHGSAVAAEIHRYLCDMRMPAGLADHFIMWSPRIAALARGFHSEADQRRSRPLRLEPGVPAASRREGPYRVLHASNFAHWAIYFPWVTETSNEFLASAAALVRQLSDLDEIALTIRSKPKTECGPDVLEALLPRQGRYRVTGTKQPYIEALADVDLVVGFMSTTLEEAVLHRVPVLLWGPTARYLHFPARRTPPSETDRAAVYAVTEEAALAPMVTAICRAHAGRPLTDAEIADFVWPVGTPGVPELAEAIAGGALPAAPAARAAA